MEEHEPFITAIESQPGDHTTRLVYADWLDDRDHPAGEYLRTELRLASLPEGGELAPNLQAKLRSLRPRIEHAWLARFDQPGVMLANPTPFPAAWWGIGLPGVRDFDATYSHFLYETLPPLRRARFTGTFDWLKKPTEGRQVGPDSAARETEYRTHLNLLLRHLSDRGLTVPADLPRWMTDDSVRCIPSSTDCGIYRSWDVALVEEPPGSRVLPFYIDSQGCITWYLYLAPEGYSAVLASGAHLCNNWRRSARANSSAPFDNAASPEDPATFAFVAPSVEAFFYRWWLENTLWFKLVAPDLDCYDPTPITPDEQAYIDYYRQHPAT